MPPKSKTKKKGVALSPEEAEEKKKQRKEKAVEKKAAKLLAAEERGKFLKMEHLRREIEHGNLNEKRFSRTWRDMVMNLKMPQIKEDLEVAWHTFDRALDVKNYSVSLLLDEADNAEEQYETNERSHLEMISRLMQTYKVRLRTEEKKYEKELGEMVDVTLAETKRITLKETDDEVFLQAMMFAMEQRVEELMKVVKGGTISKVGEMEDNNRNLRRVTKLILERKFHELWEEYVDNLTKYQTDTEDLRRDYDLAKEKDDIARRIISRQVTRTVNLFDSIRKFRDKISGYKLTAANEISEILSERDVFNEAYWIVKTRFMLEQTEDKDKLKIVTAEFKTTTKQLTRILTKGESLLSLVGICRKYETLEEKVLPFKCPLGLDENPEEMGMMDFGWERSHAVIEEFRNLELFWRRVGSVKLITKQLRMERDKLRKENGCLRECLEHFLTERSMPPSPTLKKETCNHHFRGQQIL